MYSTSPYLHVNTSFFIIYQFQSSFKYWCIWDLFKKDIFLMLAFSSPQIHCNICFLVTLLKLCTIVFNDCLISMWWYIPVSIVQMPSLTFLESLGKYILLCFPYTTSAQETHIVTQHQSVYNCIWNWSHCVDVTALRGNKIPTTCLQCSLE